MASSVDNVYAAMPKATGALRWAPLGTTLPTDAITALDGAFVDLGYIGEDGFTESNSRDVTKKKAFGGSTVKILQTDYTATVSFTFLESINANVLKAVFGEDNVTVTPAAGAAGNQVKVSKNKATLPHKCWVIDTIDGDMSYRSVIADGQVMTIGDITVTHTDTIMYTVTIEAFEVNGTDNIVTYTDDGAAPAIPVIGSRAPSGTLATAGGEILVLTGSGFVGTTGVAVGGTAVGDFQVISDTQISIITPAKAAGAHNIVVTNATGPSAGFSVTYA
jgi:hypothetical protein